MNGKQKVIPVATNGFTLIEVVAVLVLIAILTAIAIPKYIDMRDETSRRTAHVVTSALDASLHLLYAQHMAAGDTGAAYNMADIYNHANLNSPYLDTTIHFVVVGNACSATIGSINFTWELNPAPNLPDESGGITEAAGW